MAKIDEVKLNQIVSTLRELDYGSLVITVHENEITQMDVTKKKRFVLSKKKKIHK